MAGRKKTVGKPGRKPPPGDRKQFLTSMDVEIIRRIKSAAALRDTSIAGVGGSRQGMARPASGREEVIFQNWHSGLADVFRQRRDADRKEDFLRPSSNVLKYGIEGEASVLDNRCRFARGRRMLPISTTRAKLGMHLGLHLGATPASPACKKALFYGASQKLL